MLNNYITGNLDVSKIVNVESGNALQARAKEFEFNIKFYTDENKTKELRLMN